MAARLAVVTGASRGIGRALTERLASAGQTVAAIARSAADLEDLAAATGAIPFPLDVSDPAGVEDVFTRILAELGVPDLVVNNAAISGGSGLTWELPEQDWWRVLEINVRGTYLCTRAVLPAMMARGSGRIVNVSSGAATYPVGLDNDGQLTSAYMASKAAVNRFTEAVAGECFSAGVRVFSMSPGMVKTDMTAEVYPEIWDAEDDWTPIDLPVDLIVDLDAGMLDALSGRYFRAAVDDWRSLAARAAAVIDLDTHALRVRALP
ncbi:MAG TPA: SDR family oxidoreductase [Acidothermaceae bacterium]|nr:SDR family oxidoreductase [Acidothermaceae bacterium]